MGHRGHIGKLGVGLITAALCLSLASRLEASTPISLSNGVANANVSMTTNMASGSTWNGGQVPTNGNDVFIVFGSLNNHVSLFLTNAASNVFVADSLTITNMAALGNGNLSVVFSGPAFFTSGVARVNFNGAGTTTAGDTTLAFSNNVTFGAMNFIGNGGGNSQNSATLTLAGTSQGNSLLFNGGGSQKNFLVISGTLGLTGTLTATNINANNSFGTISGNSTVGNVIINNAADNRFTITNSTMSITGAVASVAGGFTLANNATMALSGGGGLIISNVAPVINGTLNIGNQTVTGDTNWSNNGTVALAGGYIGGGNLTNSNGATLLGYGNLSNVVVNLGTIWATNNTLAFASNIVQSGTMTIGSGSTLSLLGSGPLTNFGAINLQGAAGAGNNAVLNLGTAALTNLSGGTITGGGIIQNASQVVNLLGGSILATNAAVELQFTNANTVGNGGTLGAIAGATLTFGTAGIGSAIITNFGTINLTGGTLNSGTITNLAAGAVLGFGTITSNLVNGGIVTATNGNLQINGTASSNGVYRAVAGTSAATLTFAGGGSISALFNTGATIQVASVLTNTGVFANQGTIVLAGGTYQSAANFTNAVGKFIVNSGAGTINAAGVFNLGTILATNATVTISNLVAQGGTVTIGNSASVALLGAGALTNFGTINLQGAAGAGSNAVLNLGTAALTNLSGGTITGGGIIQNASQVVNLSGGTILATNAAVELQFTNANTVGNGGTIGAATGATLTFGTAGAGSAIITNFGTINLTGGTLNSGNITNLANGFFGGTGLVTAAVMNQGRMSFSGTISNGLLDSGSFTLNNDTTITSNIVVNSGGVLDLVGNNLTNSAVLTINSGGVLTNGGAANIGATVMGGVTNGGTIYITANTYFNGTVTNTGAFIFQGAISNNLVNSGSGTITLNNAATITQTANINGGTLNLNGQTMSNGLLLVSGTGVVTNAVVGATVNGGISNAATVNFSADAYINGAVTNTGYWLQRGAISNGVVNSGTMLVLSNNIAARITGGVVNSGSLTFTNVFVTGPVTNSGSFSLSGAISNNYVQTGGSVTLGNTATITGTANVTAGNFDLNGKTYTNGLMIVSGTGVLTSSLANATFNGGLSNAATVFLPLTTTFNGPVTNMAAFSWLGTINNAYAQGAGTNQLLGTATITGNVSLNGGLMDLNGNNEAFGALTGASGTILNNGAATGTLTIGANNSSGTFSGTITNGNGAVALVKTGTGTETLTGANGYSGATVVIGGTLQDGTANALPIGTALTVSNAVFDLDGNAQTVAGLSDANGNATGTVTNSSATATFTVNNSTASSFAGKIAGAMALTKTGAGVLTLSGANTYTGDTTIGGGTLKLGANNVIPDGASAGNVADNGTLDMGGFSDAVNGLSGTGVVDNSGAGTPTLTVGNNNASSTFSGVVQNTTGTLALTKTGSGVLTLAGGSANTYSGLTTVNTGELDLDKTAGLDAIATGGLTIGGGLVKLINGNQIDNAAAVTINTGTFDLNGNTESFNALGGTGGTITNSSSNAGTLTIGSNNGGGSYSGTIDDGAGTISLIKTGTGTGTLSGNSTYSGGTVISSGTLVLGSSTALGTGGLALGTTGFLSMNGFSITVANLSGAGTISETANTPDTLTVGTDNTSTTYAGVLTDTASQNRILSLVKTGTGVLTLTGNNSYDGSTTIDSGGALNIQNANALGTTTAGTTVNSGGALQIQGGITTPAEALTLNGTGVANDGALRNISGNNTFAGAITLGSATRINSDSGTLTLSSFNTGGGFALTVGGAGNVDFTAAIPSTVTTLTKDGAGTLILANSGDAYTGDTTISAGALKLGTNGVLPDGSGKGNIVDNGTLDMAGFNETINGLSGGGTVDNSTGTGNLLIIGNNNASSTFSGVIQNTSGSLNLEKTGSGTLTLSGGSANTYSGTMTVTAGELDLDKTAGVNAIGGPLTITGGEVKLLANEQIANGAVVTVNSGGSFSLNGATETAGNMIIASGGLLTNGVAGGTLNNGITNAGTVFVSQPTYLNGPVTNTGVMAFIGAISNSLVNRASFSLNDDSTITVAPINTGTMDANGNTLTVNPDWANSGTILLGGGSLAGGNLTNNSGATVMEFGAISNAVINSGNVIATNGELRLVGVVSGAGAYKAALTGTLTFAGGGSISALFNTNATVQLESTITNNSLFVNQGTIVLNAGTYQSSANFTNAAGEFVIASDDSTLSAAALVNRGTILTTNATLLVSNLVIQSGTVTIGNGGTLMLVGTGALTNSGAITLAGSAVLGSNAVLNLGSTSLINSNGSTITGGGVIQNASPVVNLLGGSILATNTSVELQFTNANTVGNAGTMGATGGATLTFGTAGVGSAIITNFGTINLTGGTLNSGTITNLIVGFLGGTGTITAPVVNQGRMNWGGTISNNLLQTAGSLTVAGSATITGTASINGGTLDLVGGQLTDGLLAIGTGATLTNGTVGATINGGVTNAGTVNFAADVYVQGAVTNTGTWLQRGAISNSLDNTGTMTLMANTINPRVTGGVVNSGSLQFSNGPGYISGAVTNSGSISFQGAISNSYVQTAGSITLAAAGTITGTASVSGGTFNLNGQTYSNGQMIVSGTGVLTNGTAGASFNGGLSNADVVVATANTFFKGPVTNTGTFLWQGAISNTFVSSGTAKLNNASTITGTSSITAGSFDLNGKSFFDSLMVVNGPGVLTNSTVGASVNGAVNLQNGAVSGQLVTNAATLSGSGTISAPLVNAAAGVITANNGLLTVTGALTQNGTVNVAASSTLNVQPAFANNGSLNMQGGFLAGGNVTNTASGNISGFGTISNVVVNANLITATGGTLTMTSAPTTQAGSGISVAGSGVLNVTPDWVNGGTLAIAAGGAVTGGTLTNTGPQLSGSGFIKSSVVNQDYMNFGGTISNNLLQTAGSFTLSGNATITGNTTINGGTLDLEGDAMTNGQLVIGSGAVLQNSGGATTLNGNITNSGTVNFFLNAQVDVDGLVVNNGTWFQTGIISNNLVNNGTFEWLTWTSGGDTPLLTGSISNSGSLALISVDAAQINGSVTNIGTFALHGTVSGNYLQTAGSFISSNATIAGTATVTGGTFDLSGNTYTGSRMILGGTGVLTNGVAGATFNSGLSNAATVFVSQNTFFTGTVTNTGTFAFMGAVSNTFANSGDVILNGSATITGQLANNGSVNVNSGTLSLAVAPTQNGSITVESGATLNAAQAWVNNGTITMAGGVITNGVITNSVFISGFGSINGGGVVNNGEIFANASSISGIGTQTVRIASFTNNNVATLGTASSNAVLNLLTSNNILINQGTISLSGGTILFNGGTGTITNYNIIAGVGNVANFPIVNAGTLASFVAQAPIPGLSNLTAQMGVTNNGLLGANNFINGAATLSLSVKGGAAAIVNQGTVAMQGGFLTINGGAGVITNVNTGLIYGIGSQNFQVANLAGGTIMASNGVLSLGLQSNANAGVLSNRTAASTILLTNKFLVNTGTIVLNGGGLLLGGSVITNEDVITGPGALSSSLYNDTAGLVVVTNGVLNVATNAGESVMNLGLFTISGDGTLNVAPSWLNTNGTVSIAGGGITGGAVTNVGLLAGFGTITSQLVNLGGGTLTASGAGSLTLVAAPTQNGWVNIGNAGTLNVLQAWLNSGLVNLQGGNLVGSTVTNSGTITGFGTITPQVRNNGGGTLIANSGALTLAVAPNQLGNVAISNAATLNVLQAWQNNGTLSLFGGTAIGSTIVNASTITGFGTITPQLQNNGGATFTATGGTLTLALSPSQAGTFVVANTGTLNVLQAWQNSGLLNMAGGTEIGSTITNAANIDGFGTITAPVINNTGATLTADTGMLTLALALIQNGTVVATNGGTLNEQAAWQNSGTVSLLGGNISGSTVTNTGTMTGFGSVQSAINNNFMFVTNGTLQATASFTQNGTVNVAANSRLGVTPNWLNAGSVFLNGGFTSGGTMTNAVSALVQGFGTISNTVANLGTIIVTNGTLNLVSAPTQLGTIIVPNAATLNGLSAWQNSGSVSMQGGNVVGAQLTNAGTIGGFGTLGSSVINNSGGTITASSGGTLTLTAIPLQNGLVNILGTLNVASAWSNGTAGTVSINGGVLTGATFTVDGTVSGNGTIAANMVISNAKTVTVNGGQMNLTALTTMNGGFINGGPSLDNYGTISGAGTVSAALSNPGYVRATNGLLAIQTLTGNQDTGILEASTSGTLAANGITPWLNNGQVILSGGTVIGGDISNNASKIISGYGTIVANVYNSGQVFANNSSQALTFNNSLVNLSSGVVTANTANLVVDGAFLNAGTLAMIHSVGTFAGSVINSGAWVSDPTTNVFQNTYTVASSGFIQSSAGDAYIFSNNATTAASFINLSTNNTQYNTLNGNFVFANTLGLTQVFATAGHDFGPVAATATNIVQEFNPDPLSFAGFTNNFALGTLQISAFTTVRVDDAFITGGVGTNDNLEAGLYLNNLIMGADSLLLISSNVQVYFITSNNWSLANVQLAGNPTYNQLFDGIHELVVVPEPAIVLLWLSSIVTVYAARRRSAPRK